MKKLSEEQVQKFQDKIWDFYRREGRKMPWRGEKDPYKVLVSEIMLQQTQVARVLQYYPKFLKAFPTLHSLSKAPLGEVLAAWQGLGYNRRAKHIHRLAKEVVGTYNGKIPQDQEALLSLPGIGKGTAGSLLAFAFNMPTVFIETNIRRVYIHHFYADKTDIKDADLLPIIEATLDRKKPREWYYALMDYGAYLKGATSNPNRQSAHYTRQSKFEGSNREVRGRILHYLTKNKKLEITDGDKVLGFDSKRFHQALRGLIKEELVKQKGIFITFSK